MDEQGGQALPVVARAEVEANDVGCCPVAGKLPDFRATENACGQKQGKGQ